MSTYIENMNLKKIASSNIAGMRVIQSWKCLEIRANVVINKSDTQNFGIPIKYSYFEIL